MDEKTKAYIAGIIDADGSISIGCRRRNHKLTEYNHTWTTKVEISMSQHNVINFIYKSIGERGSLYMKLPENGKPLLRLTLEANTCREILPQLLPYLIAKREQAELALEMLDIIRNVGKRKRSEEIENKACHIYNKMRTLNIRGLKSQRPYNELKVRISEVT